MTKERQFRLPLLLALLAIVLGAWAYIDTPALTPGQVLWTFATKHQIDAAAVAYGQAGSAPRVVTIGGTTPERRYLLASLSKPLTGDAVLRLEDAGRLSLDEHASRLLPEFASAPDKRYMQITIRQMLQHTAGWDSKVSGDPIVDALRRDGHGCLLVATARLAQPLDFNPGTKYAYSNLGYCWLGILIERASGQPYEKFVKGLPQMRGSTLQVSSGPLSMSPASSGWEGSARDVFAYYSAKPTLIDPVPTGQPGKQYSLGRGIEGPYTGHFGATTDPASMALAFRDEDGLVVVAMLDGITPQFSDDLHRLREDLFTAARRVNRVQSQSR